MPAQKYHCDYCDKQFYDTKKSRERHLQGVSHLRAKKLWFDSFRGPGTSAPEPALSNYLMKDLPPSLRPPPEGGYPQLFPVDWG